MKCKRCGSQLKETDKICLNCGALVSNSENDLYDDINVDDEDESYLDDSDSDSNYNKELEDLLNSYRKEDKTKNDSSSFPDYSNFNSVNDNKVNHNFNTNFSETSENYYNNNFNNPSISTGANKDIEMEDYTVDDLISISDDNTYNSYDEYSTNNKNNSKNKEKKKLNINLNFIPFKAIFIIAIVVFVVILGMLGYKYLDSKSSGTVDYEIDKNENKVTSKYSLKTNPNYIEGKTWVCGSSLEDGSLSNDVDTYFQYDFNKKNKYEMQFLNKSDTYENGTYGISLEDISNDHYTYKLTMLANLDGGYKTRYTFTLITNKEGTKATYKLNSTQSSCEEMEYFNNKNK